MLLHRGYFRAGHKTVLNDLRSSTRVDSEHIERQSTCHHMRQHCSSAEEGCGLHHGAAYLEYMNCIPFGISSAACCIGKRSGASPVGHSCHNGMMAGNTSDRQKLYMLNVLWEVSVRMCYVQEQRSHKQASYVFVIVASILSFCTEF